MTDDIDKLIEALGGDYEFTRKPAAEALMKIGDARAVEPLLLQLQNSHNTNEFRVEISEYLEKFLKNSPSSFSRSALKTISRLNIRFTYSTSKWKYSPKGTFITMADHEAGVEAGLIFEPHDYSSSYLEKLAREELIHRSRAKPDKKVMALTWILIILVASLLAFLIIFLRR